MGLQGVGCGFKALEFLQLECVCSSLWHFVFCLGVKQSVKCPQVSCHDRQVERLMRKACIGGWGRGVQTRNASRKCDHSCSIRAAGFTWSVGLPDSSSAHADFLWIKVMVGHSWSARLRATRSENEQIPINSIITHKPEKSLSLSNKTIKPKPNHKPDE